jgi:isoamylase
MTKSSRTPLGVTLVDGGANVAVFSSTADRIEFCTFDSEGVERRYELTNRTGYVFHDIVPGVEVGTRYGLRAHGAWDPAAGLRHNPAKLLLDPYATAIDGEYEWGQALFGHRMDSPDALDDTDSASAMPKCIVADRSFDWGDDHRPSTPLGDTVVYEMHVKGFTQLHPDVPETIRGTYAGLAHPAAIRHLTDLGVTAVELLPTHQFVQDSTLQDKGLRNYWGYNTVGFLAPHNEYSASGSTGEQVVEFKRMVKALHEAGIEVWMDVVYNHTAEGNHMGPTLSFKGLDNEAYYRLVEGDEAHYFDTTGTGNSLNVSHPAALALIMDSLRYWVQEMHVDGFRFDLATTLTRQDGEAEKHSAFLDIIHQDPVLRTVKMVAEPWDTAGYQVGGFPADWSEWNGKFRDDVRSYWGGSGGTLGEFVQRVLGSPDIYEASRRSPLCSVDFVTAHDGFTLADLTSYAEKHNEANGEDNRDGESNNGSFNGGVEGPTDDAAVNEYRLRQRKNLLGTLLFSTGVPMILGGDEMGRTQGGNNNAYCQDNEISWFDWKSADEDLLEFTKQAIALRKEHRALTPDWFRVAPDGDRAIRPGTVQVLRADARPFETGDWLDPANMAVLLVLADPADDQVALLVNASGTTVEFTLPGRPGHGEHAWRLGLSSDPEQRVDGSGETLLVRDASFTVLV